MLRSACFNHPPFGGLWVIYGLYAQGSPAAHRGATIRHPPLEGLMANGNGFSQSPSEYVGRTSLRGWSLRNYAFASFS